MTTPVNLKIETDSTAVPWRRCADKCGDWIDSKEGVGAGGTPSTKVDGLVARLVRGSEEIAVEIVMVEPIGQ